MSYTEIDSKEKFEQLLEGKNHISKCVFQNINLSLPENIHDYTFSDNVFLGCIMHEPLIEKLSINNIIIPTLPGLPYNCFPGQLYERHTLLNNYTLGQPESYSLSLDNQVYNHFLSTGKIADSIYETLARRLHDHSITDSLEEFISQWDEKKVVAIMGGHNLSRNAESYEKIVRISKQLTEEGYLMVSGGGPGAMEATHVGAWLAGRDESLVKVFIEKLSEAPSYKDEYWLDKAFELIERYPQNDYESLGIPTWLYGHEPPTPFASKIAKYFANSVREDGLLTIAKGGIVFAPGSAGTIQEIFQEATQNHYLSFGYASPMIFLNEDYWTNDRPVYPLLESMMKEGKYQHLLLSITDDGKEVMDTVRNFSD